MTDFLLPLREGDDNEECRYAIRSWVSNAGMTDADQLVVVGHRPKWLEPDIFIPGNEHRSGAVNVYENVRKACLSNMLHDDVIVVNDDFFAIESTDPHKVRHRGRLAAHIRGLQQPTWWAASLRLTHAYLRSRGIGQPMSYELHRPLPIDPDAMGRILTEAWKGHGFPPQWRTLYGNLAGIDGQMTVDIKALRRAGEFNGPWFSTTDAAWRLGWGERISEMFPERSPWERL